MREIEKMRKNRESKEMDREREKHVFSKNSLTIPKFIDKTLLLKKASIHPTNFP